jgi:hypothetical protein
MTDAVPEADALEQRQPLLEGDALDQAIPAPFDEDDAPR